MPHPGIMPVGKPDGLGNARDIQQQVGRARKTVGQRLIEGTDLSAPRARHGQIERSEIRIGGAHDGLNHQHGAAVLFNAGDYRIQLRKRSGQRRLCFLGIAVSGRQRPATMVKSQQDHVWVSGVNG